MLVGLGLTLNAQKVVKEFAADTVKGAETVYFPMAGNKIELYAGVVSFSFAKTDIADSLSLLRIQGANRSDFADATNLTGTAALAYTTTDGYTVLYTTPPIYLYYRLAATCAAGDTVRLYNVTGLYKKVE